MGRLRGQALYSIQVYNFLVTNTFYIHENYNLTFLEHAKAKSN